MEAGMSTSRPRGFTLVELLVVILIITVLASLLIPVLLHVLNVVREGAAETLVSQLIQSVTVYEHDQAAFPPGDGSGTRELVTALRKPGAKGMPYLAISEDMLTPEGDLINPALKDGEPPLNILHYRNTRGGKRGPDLPGPPGIRAIRGCDFEP